MAIDNHCSRPVPVLLFLPTPQLKVGTLAPELSAPNEESTRSVDY
jgi:hypothetical protein